MKRYVAVVAVALLPFADSNMAKETTCGTFELNFSREKSTGMLRANLDVKKPHRLVPWANFQLTLSAVGGGAADSLLQDLRLVGTVELIHAPIEKDSLTGLATLIKPALPNEFKCPPPEQS